jgi:hypothetical protein
VNLLKQKTDLRAATLLSAKGSAEVTLIVQLAAPGDWQFDIQLRPSTQQGMDARDDAIDRVEVLVGPYEMSVVELITEEDRIED